MVSRLSARLVRLGVCEWRIRENPNLEAEELGFVDEAACVRITARQGDWLGIRVEEGPKAGLQGWALGIHEGEEVRACIHAYACVHARARASVPLRYLLKSRWVGDGAGQYWSAVALELQHMALHRGHGPILEARCHSSARWARCIEILQSSSAKRM